MRSGTRSVVVAAVLALTSIGLAAPAGGAPTCTYDAATLTVTVDVGNGEVATISRAGAAITLDGLPCGVATVQTTDTIVVNGMGMPAEVAIDLTGGPFEPGATTETDGGTSEIEFSVNLPSGAPTLRIVGSAGPDHVVIGSGGVNLNADEANGDADVTITGGPAVVVAGGAGDDVISVAGGAGTGASGPGATLLGQDAADRLLGGLGGSAFDGGPGIDVVDYASATRLLSADLSTGTVTHEGGATDALVAIENLSGSPGDDTIAGDDQANDLGGAAGADTIRGGEGDDTIDGGGGTDAIDLGAADSGVIVDLGAGIAVGEGSDTLASIENVLGSPGNDVIAGDANANVLDGGDGNDTINGRRGDDVLIGGAGADTASFVGAGAGVTVKLKDGTATGAGQDSLSGFENVAGSGTADTIHGNGGPNRLEGGAGGDQIFGRGGPDTISGEKGPDLLYGQKGDDALNGGTGRDQLDGGKGDDVCRGGADPDSFVFCETIHVGPRFARFI